MGELFEESNSETNSENTKPNIKVFGVGKAGINVLSNILQNQNIKKLLSYENIDTDTGTLKEKDSSSNLLIGKDSLQGLGTFGNPNYGEEAIQESEKLLQEKLNAAGGRRTEAVFLQHWKKKSTHSALVLRVKENETGRIKKLHQTLI